MSESLPKYQIEVSPRFVELLMNVEVNGTQPLNIFALKLIIGFSPIYTLKLSSNVHPLLES